MFAGSHHQDFEQATTTNSTAQKMKDSQPLLRLSKCKTSIKKVRRSNPEIVLTKGGSEKKRSLKAQLKSETLFEKLLKGNSASKKETTNLAPAPSAQKTLRSGQKTLKTAAISLPTAVHTSKIIEEKQVSPKFGNAKAIPHSHSSPQSSLLI